MSLNTIGILGCGGHIGKYATEKLLRLVFKFWVHKEIVLHILIIIRIIHLQILM